MFQWIIKIAARTYTVEEKEAKRLLASAPLGETVEIVDIRVKA